MNRIGDQVRINGRPIPGACILGVVIAMAGTASGQTKYTIKDEANNEHETSGVGMVTEQAAAPRHLEGATIKDGNNLIACTVVRVNSNGTTIDLIADKATRLPRDSEDFDQPDQYDHEPDPFGVQYTARQRSDGNWYLKGSETATVTIGVRETCEAPATVA